MRRRLQILFSAIIVLLVSFGRCAYNDVKVSFDCSQTTLALSLESKSDVTNCRAIDGSIKVSATGGSEPYDYAIAGREFQTNNVFTNLGGGNYEIIVKDMKGCTKSIFVKINAAGSTLAATVQTTADSECSTDNGVAIVSATGGVAPYQYQIDSKGFTDSNTFNDLKEGQHEILVKDSEGCQTTLSVKIEHGNTGISYNNEIKAIIATNCAKSGCHDSGEGPRDWTDFKNVKANAANIKIRTANRQMPPDRQISQADIDKIGCWVDDGALDN